MTLPSSGTFNHTAKLEMQENELHGKEKTILKSSS